LARKVKPRWGWDRSRDYDAFNRRMNNISIDHLCSLIGFNESNSGDNRLGLFEHSIGTFYFDQFGIKDPSSKETQAALSELKNATERFKFCVSNLDGISKSVLGQGFEERFVDSDDGSYAADIADLIFREKEKLETMLSRLVEAIDQAPNEERPTKRGPKGNPAVYDLIRQFGHFYERNTGRKAFDGFINDQYDDDPSGGPFFDAVEYFINGFAPDLNLSNQSIGEYIRRTVGDKVNR